MKISSFTQGKDNNFNLIRIVAAFTVLLGHSFPLTGAPDPTILGLGITTIAVDIFFITSGFLVAGSLLRRRSGLEFLWARILRIYPALIVMLIITVLGVGLFFTTLSASSYLSDHITHRYFVKCATLISNVTYKLPGVFENNPYKNAVNGSLWTLPYEVRLYLLLLVFWLVSGVISKSRLIVLTLCVVVCAVLSGVLFIYSNVVVFKDPELPRLSYLFFVGGCFFLFGDKIPLKHSVFLCAVIVLLISTINKHAFFAIYYICIAYFLFYLAYIPSGFVKKYNSFGDYSYGIYIYAFPVQQSIAALDPDISVSAMMLFSSIITLPLAVLSWHLVERNCLGLRRRYVGKPQAQHHSLPDESNS